MNINTPESGRAHGRPGSDVPLGDNGEVSEIVEQARGRSDGFDYGDDRAIGNEPNWDAYDSDQLYQFAMVNNVPGTAEDLGQRWQGHSRDLAQASEDLYNAISELGAVWIGEGAGAAQGSLVGIANSGAQASAAANVMGNRCSRQAAAASEVKKMPQPEEFDPAAETAGMLAGGPPAMTRDMKDKFDKARETKAQQVAYLKAYTDSMSDVDNSTPSFGPASLGLKPMTGGPGVGTGSVGGVGSVGGPSGVGFSPGGTPAVGAPNINSTFAQAELAAQAYAQGQGAGGGVMSGPPGAPHAPAGPAPGTGAGAAPPPAAASSGPGVGASLGAAAAGGALGFAGAKALGKGNKSGSNKDSSSTETETEAAATGQASGAAAVPQQGVVPPAGTIGAGQAAAASMPPPAAGAPMGGMGGMGGMGAAGGQQNEDEDHTHASFLIEVDPDETFGANQSAAPPVLGAWGPDEGEER